MIRVVGVGLLLLCLGLGAMAQAAGESDDERSAATASAGVEVDAEDEEEQSLRERLTQREDRRRPERSWTTHVGGRPLVISGEWELKPRFVRRRVIGPDPVDPLDPDPVRQRDRLLTETGIEVEAFYSFGESLSLFAQGKLASERDLIDLPDRDPPNRLEGQLSKQFLEVGEVWLISEDVFGTGLDLDLGRIHFEDARRWWWDDDIEGARVAFEGDGFEASLAFARRLISERLDENEVDPEEERLGRWLAHAQWEPIESHGFELFAVHQADRSRTERPGEIVRSLREDESDARLRWLGARAMGAFDLRPRAIAGYWLDLAWLRGKERRIEYDDEDPGLPPRRSEVDEVLRRRVRGGAFDAGLSLELASWLGQPRIYTGYARGSRDFRQSGLQNDESGFGGVERFPSYGVLVEPELSNLRVKTLGIGTALLESSSLDLVLHHYELGTRSPNAPLPGLALERVDAAAPTHTDLGREIDLVLALEEWERLEFELSLAAFRAGRAFARGARGETSFGAEFSVRVSF